MHYRIFGGNLPAVTLTLDAGESIYTQSGGMAWMTDGFSMDTNLKGGLMKGLGRMLTGESPFLVTYTSGRACAQITLASTFPGSILAFELDGTKELICQRSAFLCATSGVALSVAVPRAKAGFFGGEGFFLQRAAGRGTVFLEVDGTAVERELAAGETVRVSTGNIAAYEGTVAYSAEMVRGFQNVVFGGQGLFLSTLTGPGRVYLQTINMHGFVGKILPYLPVQKDS